MSQKQQSSNFETFSVDEVNDHLVSKMSCLKAPPLESRESVESRGEKLGANARPLGGSKKPRMPLVGRPTQNQQQPGGRRQGMMPPPAKAMQRGGMCIPRGQKQLSISQPEMAIEGASAFPRNRGNSVPRNCRQDLGRMPMNYQGRDNSLGQEGNPLSRSQSLIRQQERQQQPQYLGKISIKNK